MRCLGNIYNIQQKYDLAEKYYLLAIELNNKDSKSMTYLGNCYYNQQKYDLTEKYYLMALNIRESIKTIIKLIEIYYIQKKYVNAVKYCALIINNKDYMSMIKLAQIFNKYNKSDEAESYYLNVIENDNNDYKYGAMHKLAFMYYSQHKYDEAIVYFLKSIDKNKNGLYWLGSIFTIKTDNAKKYYLMSVEECKDKHAMCILGKIYENDKNYIEAENYYLMGAKHGYEKSLINLMRIYKINKKYDDLIEIYHQYHKIYDINIDNIVMSILDNKITINDKSKISLNVFDFKVNDSIVLQHKLEILKFTNELSSIDIYDNDRYITFKYLKYNIMPYRKYIKFPKFLIIKIAKCLFI